jgi:D-cysteine desulfhydrase
LRNIPPLFKHFKSLAFKIPWLPLGHLPTPLVKLVNLSEEFKGNIWLKNDGLSHPVYGGNKIRKFEFIFAEATRKKKKRILTGGGLGSNHVVASSMVAKELDMKTTACLFCQPIDEHVRENLLLNLYFGTGMKFCGDFFGVALSFIGSYMKYALLDLKPPFFIYPGGSSKRGILGYLNAGMEIYEQTKGNSDPSLDALFVACGTGGTFAGLLLAKKLFRHPWDIYGVRVTPRNIVSREKVAEEVNTTVRWLHHLEPSLPLIRMSPREVALVEDYLGRGYGAHTKEGEEAVTLLREKENLRLENTYTGKAMAALFDYARENQKRNILFINTFSSAPLEEKLRNINYHRLPEKFHFCFGDKRPVRCFCFAGYFAEGFCPKNY